MYYLLCSVPNHSLPLPLHRRDGKGCSNGCFVLGYRVYVDGAPRLSVDGPMTYETSVRWPRLDSTHKLEIHVR